MFMEDGRQPMLVVADAGIHHDRGGRRSRSANAWKFIFNEPFGAA